MVSRRRLHIPGALCRLMLRGNARQDIAPLPGLAYGRGRLQDGIGGAATLVGPAAMGGRGVFTLTHSMAALGVLAARESKGTEWLDV